MAAPLAGPRRHAAAGQDVRPGTPGPERRRSRGREPPHRRRAARPHHLAAPLTGGACESTRPAATSPPAAAIPAVGPPSRLGLEYAMSARESWLVVLRPFVAGLVLAAVLEAHGGSYPP